MKVLAFNGSPRMKLDPVQACADARDEARRNLELLGQFPRLFGYPR